MNTSAMQDLWSRFEVWLRANAPQLLETLQPGATDEQITQAEAFMSVQFPEDFKASCRIHNGSVANTNHATGLTDLLSLERIQNEWKIWKDLYDSGEFDEYNSKPFGPIRSEWWNPQWIPLTHDGSGNHYCLDLNPAEGGHVGQTIEFWHDDPARMLLAESFSSWFAAFVEGCETGEYIYSDEYDGIVNIEDI